MSGAPTTDEARSGTDLGPYRIDSLLGTGGMGVVYRAVHRETGRTYALKLLRATLAQDPERRRRFVREARLAATLDHPGIVKTHEAGDADGDAFIAMELVEGESLKLWIAEHRAQPDLRRGLAIARGIASAVAHAHDKGVVHRDLKPDNVMVTRDAVRVLDFGLAKLREIEGGALYQAETETSLTHEGKVLGTPGYMSPEQASGREVGFPTDVFALGAILYEVVTGERAFSGNSAIDVIVSVTRDQPPLPSTKNPASNDVLDALVMRCLEKDPAARPSMNELASALAKPSLLERRRPRQSRRVLAVAFGVATAVVIAGVAVISKQGSASTHVAPADAATDAAPVPTAVTDLPLPASAVPGALELYKKAIRDERDGSEDAEEEALEAATAADPTMAAAHLRLALALAGMVSTGAYSRFAQAMKYRERLGARDRELLEAAQPLFQSDPPDTKSWRDRLEGVAQRFPGDAGIIYQLSAVRLVMGDFAGAESTARRAVALDPEFGLALAQTAQIQAYRGELAESRATIKQCLDRTPGATSCMWLQEFLETVEGRCDRLEVAARRRIAVDPALSEGYKSLVYGLMALGRPDPLVREAIDQALRHFTDDYEKRRFDLSMSARLAVRRGDFVSARKLSEELQTLTATRSDAPDRGAGALLAAEIEREAGRPDEAAKIAKRYLERRDAWQVYPVIHDYTMASDLTPLLTTFVQDPKYMPPVDRQSILDEWRRRYDQGAYGDYRPYVWVYGYAASVVTASDAQSALEVLPRYLPIPPFLPNGAIPRLSIGRTLWLGGREDEGIRYLSAAAKECAMPTRPIESILSHAFLAQALEKKGDAAGACKELAVVLSHWGNAKPRSVTAEWARTRGRALGCEAR